ncbi:erythromycin esterase family protein [Deinococcus arcticus]|uniref:Erythromycin esterase n=1 Tax=Deinococcus arcticus TaxID=2136176 RepID=A0A2T3WBL7_9DEIO|nr:erythromycin esterase family protein [Deinococcus arcticus]PTA69232.1 erythromycin esterase [Deinococcus arcticus]
MPSSLPGLHPLTDPAASDALLSRIGDARFVLIGEASHGTHEFYRERAALTRRLIEERGFTAVAAEADWPDASRVNRYVRGQKGDHSAEQALGDFGRFPRWMWRNEPVRDFVTWLRGHNERRPQAQAGFYGIDLYSLHRSMDAVVAYLEGVDPAAAQRARQRYSCFEPYGNDPQSYGLATAYGVDEPCEDEAVAQLLELQRQSHTAADPLASDELFYAEQNARLALNAERYYREMFRGRLDTWNLRDTHMADTVGALAEHQRAQGLEPRIVVWAHNSHLGDARATEPGWRQRQENLGQYLRQRWPGQTFILGQSTCSGEVLAADDWGKPGQVKRVRPALAGSVEAALHELGVGDFWLDLRGDLPGAFQGERLQRFIGVIYRPDTERQSHYYHAHLPAQYDALLYLDQTTALVPLDRDSGGEEGELPNTYPSGQ